MFKLMHLSGFGSAADTGTPVFLSSNSTSVNEGDQLSFDIIVNKIVSIDIGGDDASHFQLVSTGFATIHTLQWIGNGTQNTALPQDANGDNVYDIVLTATDRLGANTSTQNLSVTVDPLSVLSFGIDGHAHGELNGNPVTATLTTASARDIIVAVVTQFSNNVATTQTSTAGTIIVTSPSLTWALRSRKRLVTSVSSFPILQETWVAHAPLPLTSEVITATAGAAGGNNYYMIEAFGVSGANIDAPFDTNSSLPAQVSFAASGGTSSHPITGISTTGADSLEFASLSTAAGGSASFAADSGFTLLDNQWANVSFGGQQTEYKINSGALSSVSQNVFSSVSAISTNYIASIDAIAKVAATERRGPKYVNSGGGKLDVNNHIQPNLPSNLVVGNLLIMHVSITSSTASPVWPAGWTVIETWTIGTQVGSKAWRYVDGTETAPNVTWVGSTGCMSQILQFKDVHASSPIGASAHNSASSASVTCSTIVTTGHDSLVLNYLDTGDTLPAPLPSPWRPRSSGGVNGAVYGCWHICDEYLPTLGTTSDSVNTTIYVASQYLNFTTEILALADDTLTPSKVSALDIFSVPSVTVVGGSITPAGVLDDMESFHRPNVGRGNISLIPALYAPGDTVSQPSVGIGTHTLTPALFAPGDTFFAPVATKGAAFILPSLISGDTFLSPSVSAGGSTPAQPVISGIRPASVASAVTSFNITSGGSIKSKNVTVFGTSANSATVHVHLDGSGTSTDVTATAFGTWSCDISGLTDAAHTVTASQTTGSGTSLLTGVYNFTVAADIGSYVSTNGSSFSIDANTVVVQHDPVEHAWSLTNPDAHTLTFSVHSGDHWSNGSYSDLTNNAGAERSEVEFQNHYAKDVEVDVTYEINVAAGSANTADFLVIGQVHQTLASGSPPYEMALGGENMEVWVLYQKTGDVSTTHTRIYRDASAITRGHTYKITVQMKFNGDGGYLRVWRDGVQIVNYTGPLGFVTSDTYYWKHGLYRGPAAEILTATYSNFLIA